MIARLFMAGEIKLMLEGSDLDPRAAVDPLTKSVRFRQVSILKRKSADSVSLKRARDLHRDVFAKLPRDDEDGLVTDTRESFIGWQSELKSYQHSAASRYHPGKSVILEIEAEVDNYLAKLRQELLAVLQEGKRARIQ